jgi:hypothetical protein
LRRAQWRNWPPVWPPRLTTFSEIGTLMVRGGGLEPHRDNENTRKIEASVGTNRHLPAPIVPRGDNFQRAWPQGSAPAGLRTFWEGRVPQHLGSPCAVLRQRSPGWAAAVNTQPLRWPGERHGLKCFPCRSASFTSYPETLCSIAGRPQVHFTFSPTMPEERS